MQKKFALVRCGESCDQTLEVVNRHGEHIRVCEHCLDEHYRLCEHCDESKGNFILVRGEIPILLVAHLDTVHEKRVRNICLSSDKNILMSPQSIDGDDRCGVFALVKVYLSAQIKPWFLFTCNEEIGGRLQKKESIGKSRGGNTTKIHAAVDALGNPLKIKLTGGQVHDVTVAPSLLADLKPRIIMADAAYDSDKLREQIVEQGVVACIKPRRNRKVVIPFDKEQYKERHLVECFFQKLKR